MMWKSIVVGIQGAPHQSDLLQIRYYFPRVREEYNIEFGGKSCEKHPYWAGVDLDGSTGSGGRVLRGGL
jgi:hypothetical protein